MCYLWIFHKKLCDKKLQKIYTIVHNGKQNLLVCCIHQILLIVIQSDEGILQAGVLFHASKGCRGQAISAPGS